MKSSKDKLSRLLKDSYSKVEGLVSDGQASAAKQANRLRDRRFCLGITGLSQSGKSTFITSLINQLVEHETASLPGFSPVLNESLLWVKVHSLEDKALASFPYESAYQGIACPNPVWPESTQDISGCLLELRLSQTTSRLNPFSSDQYSLYLEIRDYPGEWLLDLPLREMSYSRWCAQCGAQYAQEPRRHLLGELFNELQQLDPLAEVDEVYLKQLNDRFVGFLQACKYDEKSLSLIQPGRFLIPGEVADPDVLCFIPLLKCASYTEGQLLAASDTRYFKICQKRYQRYIKELVEPFYKNFCSQIDRQLILVDVVSALNAGPEYIDDMRQALTNITDSFSYGSRNRLLQLFSPKIDKIVFVATKVDQLLSEDHEAVRRLLAVIVKQAYKNAQHEGVSPVCEAAAAVRSSREVDHEGAPSIIGATIGGKPVGYFPPNIPCSIPVGAEWEPFLSWSIPALNPPKGLSHKNHDVIPHIRMDTLLNELIGDKCV